MFTRLVKMEFYPEKVEAFIAHFKSVKSTIEAQEGCVQVTLFRDKNKANIFFTYSQWEDEKYLEMYRNSPFFKEVWSFTKTLFNAKPMAWSVDALEF